METRYLTSQEIKEAAEPVMVSGEVVVATLRETMKAVVVWWLKRPLGLPAEKPWESQFPMHAPPQDPIL